MWIKNFMNFHDKNLSKQFGKNSSLQVDDHYLLNFAVFVDKVWFCGKASARNNDRN